MSVPERIEALSMTFNMSEVLRNKVLNTFSPAVPMGPASPVGPDLPFGPSGPSSPLEPRTPTSP